MGKQSDSGLLVCHSSLILFAFSYSEPFQFPSEHLWETLLWHSVNQDSLTKKELASFIHRDEKQGAATMLMMWKSGVRHSLGLVSQMAHGERWDFVCSEKGSECQFSCQAKCNKREKRPVEVFFKIFEDPEPPFIFWNPRTGFSGWWQCGFLQLKGLAGPSICAVAVSDAVGA